MSEGREIHCYDYVNHSYQQVHDVLSKDAAAIFQAATKAAVSRAEAVVSELRIDIAGVQVSKDAATVPDHACGTIGLSIDRYRNPVRFLRTL